MDTKVIERMTDEDFEQIAADHWAEGYDCPTGRLIAEARRARQGEADLCAALRELPLSAITGFDHARGILTLADGTNLVSEDGLTWSKPISSAAALMGAKGGRAGKGKPKPHHIAATAKARGAKGGAKGGAMTGATKRRDVDYAALGRKGGLVTKVERER